MKKVLVLGGTRFFGKRLVELLLQDQDSEVTILTRGLTEDTFGERVARLAVDRTDEAALEQAVGGTVWDIVYDNICYTPDEAAAAVRIWAGRAKRYILTSSLSVYDPQPEALAETDFDPWHYPLKAGGKADVSYQEGKGKPKRFCFRQRISRWLRYVFRLYWARMIIRAGCIFTSSMFWREGPLASLIRRQRFRSSVRMKRLLSCIGWAGRAQLSRGR